MYELCDVPEKLKRLREYRGIKNQSKAAEALGISRFQYNTYETGHKEPGFNVLLNICNIFEVDIHYFFNIGSPEEFSTKSEGRKKEYNIKFIETSVSKKIFSICENTLTFKDRILVNVLPLSGVTISLRHFIDRNSDCCIIDAVEGLKKPIKKGIKLYIIDHGHKVENQALISFIEDLIKENAGIILITKPPFQSGYFEEIQFINDLTLDDINAIILDSFAFLKDIAKKDSPLVDKILITITGEVFDNLGKLKKLLSFFSDSNIQNLSLFNLLNNLKKRIE